MPKDNQDWSLELNEIMERMDLEDWLKAQTEGRGK